MSQHPDENGHVIVWESEQSSDIKLWARHDTPKKVRPYPPYSITLDGEVVTVFDSNSQITDYRRATLFTRLLERTVVPVVEDRTLVPIEMLADGNASIAAYLFTVHRYSEREICDIMSVTRRTVKQYISDIKNGRR